MAAGYMEERRDGARGGALYRWGGEEVAWRRGKGRRKAAAVSVEVTARRRAGSGVLPELGDDEEVGWAVAWPGSWAGPVGGEVFF